MVKSALLIPRDFSGLPRPYPSDPSRYWIAIYLPYDDQFDVEGRVVFPTHPPQIQWLEIAGNPITIKSFCSPGPDIFIHRPLIDGSWGRGEPEEDLGGGWRASCGVTGACLFRACSKHDLTGEVALCLGVGYGYEEYADRVAKLVERGIYSPRYDKD